MLAVLPGLVLTYGGFAAICVWGSRLGRSRDDRDPRNGYRRTSLTAWDRR